MSGYQSKVFNFLSRQSLRLRDQSAQTWRKAKVAAVWGVQILLYPVYLGFQSSRLVGKQLKQTTRQTLPRLQAVKQRLQGQQSPPSDQPIQKTLKAIAALTQEIPQPAADDSERLALYLQQYPEVQVAHHNDSVAVVTKVVGSIAANETAPDLVAVRVQGVASLLETGSLVLVTTRNQILDVLTAEQQAQLHRRIVWEIASYQRQQRFSLPSRQPWVSTYLSPPKDRKNALLPIRIFRNAMAWMQRGSVAVSANLFQESRLANSPAVLLSLPQSSAEPPLRLAQPAWVTMESQFYERLSQASRTVIGLLIGGLAAGLDAVSQGQGKPVAKVLNRLNPAKPPALPQLSAAKPSWIVMLDHWLSKVPGLSEPPVSPQTSPQPRLSEEFFKPDAARRDQSLPASSQPSKAGIQSWLRRSLRQLIAQRSLSVRENPATWEVTDTAAQEAALKTRFAPINQPEVNQIEIGIDRSSIKRARRAAHEEWDADLGMLPTRRTMQPLDAPLSSLDTANQEEAAMIPQSWIETEAQLVSYVKHPLEQLLEWIDQGMVWIEQGVAKLWHWLTRPLG